jgi:superfamily II DNA or RNA helicase
MPPIRKFIKPASKKPMTPRSAAIFVPTEQYLDQVRSVAYLGKKGYTVPKSILLAEDYAYLKNALYVKPVVMGQPQEEGAFSVYRENDAKIYLPRFYGIKRYGLPDKSEIQEGDDIDIEFTGDLRDYQQNIIKTYLDYVEKPICNGSDKFGGGGILEVPCGRGKCLGKDTPILMFDGEIKLVQDIVVGDSIMGDDSTPRKVLTLARGRETMYRVSEIGTDRFYIVNESHILSLKNKYSGDICDISVLDYLFKYRDDGWLGYRIKNNIFPITYEFCIEVIGEDDYYGFEIDGNHRFVLGDFTVTHNTVMGLKIISEVGATSIKKGGGGGGKKTIILVHKEFLMNQWIERIADFLPSARVGKIQANKLEIEGKDIVIGMIQTLFTRDFPANTFDSFGLLIIDEVHHIGSEMFSRTLLKIVTPYVLGISATVERKDKLTKVLYMFIGDKIYSEERKQDDAVTVHGIYYKTADEAFNETEYDFKGQPKYSTMISKLCEYGPRSDFIVKVLTDLIGLYGQKGQVMILSHNRSLLSYLYKAIEHRRICTVGFYVGGMKEKDLKDTEEKKVVLATYSMAAEALDIKTLSMLIMASPKKDIEQSVGRILRVKHENPIVVDIVDSHQLFQNQWQVRKRFYKKCNYGILSIESGNYKGMAPDNGWNRVYSPVGCSLNESEKCDYEIKEGIVEEDTQNKISRLAKYI